MHYFHTKSKILIDFQICISLPLRIVHFSLTNNQYAVIVSKIINLENFKLIRYSKYSEQKLFFIIQKASHHGKNLNLNQSKSKYCQNSQNENIYNRADFTKILAFTWSSFSRVCPEWDEMWEAKHIFSSFLWGLSIQYVNKIFLKSNIFYPLIHPLCVTNNSFFEKVCIRTKWMIS